MFEVRKHRTSNFELLPRPELLTAHCLLLTHSVLPAQMRRRTGFPDDPVTVYVGSDLLPHRVFTKQAPYKSDRRDHAIEDKPQNNSRVDPAQDMSQRHPPRVDPGQASGEYEGRNHQQSRQYDGPPSGIVAMEQDRPKRNNGENAADGQPKRSQLLIL
jgi:hypothetical protein